MTTERNPEEIQKDIRHTRARMDEKLDAIEHRLSPGELLDKSLAYLKGPGGYASELTGNLGDKLKENPLPLALIGIGLGWLMMSNGHGSEPRGSRSRPYAGSYGRSPNGLIVSPSGDPYDASSRSGLKETAEQAGERISAEAHSVKERASAAGERIEQSWDEARAATSSAAARAQHQMEHLGRQGRRQLRRARGEFDHLMQEQPLVLGAIGVLAGVAIGASLPPTRREDELVGEYRDQLFDEAAAQGEAYKQKARHVAEAALNEGSREARAQGLNERDGKQEAGKVKDALKGQIAKAEEKIERVGAAAFDAAKREAERQNLKKPEHNPGSAPLSGS